jgi:ATP-dependent exoDNAse (exonuclease V) beta subunit
MKSILYNRLSLKNAHPRDKNILFTEKGHKYTILTDPDNEYTSVTTLNHSYFEQFDADAIIDKMMKGRMWKSGHKYWGFTAEQIKSQWDNNKNIAAKMGTSLHYEIECFYNRDLEEDTNKDKGQSIEWQYFLNFVNDFPHLIPYRTEWLVYHEDVKVSGSIDMVFENPDGTLSIYDWKRAKEITRMNNFNKFAIPCQLCHLPDSNFWHYALQLNTYKTILEQKYGKTVKELFLVRLHPDANNYELIKLPDLSIEVNAMFLDIRK